MTVYCGSNSGEQPTLKAAITNGIVSQVQIFSRRFRTDIWNWRRRDIERALAFLSHRLEEPGFAYVDSLRMRFEIREGRIASILVS